MCHREPRTAAGTASQQAGRRDFVESCQTHSFLSAGRGACCELGKTVPRVAERRRRAEGGKIGTCCSCCIVARDPASQMSQGRESCSVREPAPLHTRKQACRSMWVTYTRAHGPRPACEPCHLYCARLASKHALSLPVPAGAIAKTAEAVVAAPVTNLSQSPLSTHTVPRPGRGAPKPPDSTPYTLTTTVGLRSPPDSRRSVSRLASRAFESETTIAHPEPSIPDDLQYNRVFLNRFACTKGVAFSFQSVPAFVLLSYRFLQVELSVPRSVRMVCTSARAYGAGAGHKTREGLESGRLQTKYRFKTKFAASLETCLTHLQSTPHLIVIRR
jgi:hypothetical protein